MVLLFLADGFEEIEALTQVDYLRRAGVDVITVGVDNKQIVGTHNIKVEADATLDEIDYSDNVEMIVLPGGLGGMNTLKANKKVASIIEKTNNDGKYITAICASPTIFAHMGLLHDKKCICYPSMTDELSQNGGIVIDAPVVTDGNIITAKAAGASEEFSFELIRVLKGQDVAQKVRQSICAR